MSEFGYKKEKTASEEYLKKCFDQHGYIRRQEYEIGIAYQAGYLQGQQDLIDYSSAIHKAAMEKK